MQQYALITGASQGIGKAFAIELAKLNIHILMVALPTVELSQTQKELQEQYPKLEIKTLGVDLTKDEAPQEIYQFCQEQKISVKYLINNAGVGYAGPFEDQTPAFFDTLMKLNMLATTKLAHIFVNQMKQLPEAYILNISSMGGLYDMPFKVVYSASKAYVYSFSRALREELKDTSISVSVLCPGGVATNAKVLEDVKKMGFFGRILTSMPHEVAEYGVKIMLNKKAMGVPKLASRIYASFRYIIPYPLQLQRIGRFFRKKFR